MKEIRVRATVVGGKLRFRSAGYVLRLLSEFKGNVAVTIAETKEPRSLNQNAYYWGVVLPVIAEHTGHPPDDLHHIFKRMFLPKKHVEYRNREMELEASTTELSTSGFAQYLERVIAEAGTLGIEVPDSKEFWAEQRRKSLAKMQAHAASTPKVEHEEMDIDPKRIPF